ncbi:MAG: DNA replication/repair protein RecF [Microbacteriaceae bacterium]|nr:DNA replication/repair protein RecF [Microbacteriaceae bacterium]
MRIISAELIGWRNYEHQSLVFESSPTLLVGPNGQGKTNFVEALIYSTTGHSHRTASDAILVKSGSSEAIIRMTVQHDTRRLTVDLRVTGSGANTIRVNGTVTKRRELARLLPLVAFAPEDMDLVRGEPEHRRMFLNDLVAEVSSALAGDIADYDRVLRQRNTLLKSLRSTPAAPPETLHTWTDALVGLATRIMVARRHLINDLSPRLCAHYRAIASSADSAMVTMSESIPDNTAEPDIADTLRTLFHVKQRDEIDRGSTLFGPHRDDMLIVLNDLPARTHSSQGEAWSCALSLRLAQVDIVRRGSIAGDPVVVLDDVFSELDAGRRDRLGEHLSGIEHVIITAADVATIPASLVGRQHTVLGGRIDA